MAAHARPQTCTLWGHGHSCAWWRDTRLHEEKRNTDKVASSLGHFQSLKFQCTTLRKWEWSEVFDLVYSITPSGYTVTVFVIWLPATCFDHYNFGTAHTQFITMVNSIILSQSVVAQEMLKLHTFCWIKTPYAMSPCSGSTLWLGPLYCLTAGVEHVYTMYRKHRKYHFR